jgi:hypothetical protein
VPLSQAEELFPPGTRVQVVKRADGFCPEDRIGTFGTVTEYDFKSCGSTLDPMLGVQFEADGYFDHFWGEELARASSDTFPDLIVDPVDWSA